MKARKLTPKQKEVFDLLSKNEGGILRQHVRPTGSICWRVLDKKMNPLLNVSENIIYQLKDKDVIESTPNSTYQLKASTEYA